MSVRVRNTTKALIINDNKILMIKCQNSIGEMFCGLPSGTIYYELPGGGQNRYETLEEAVKRECFEETGYTVSVERLAAIYEEILMDEEFRAEWGEYAHVVHFLFVCNVNNEPAQLPSEKDIDMLGFEWVDMASLGCDFLLHPRIIRANLEWVLASENTLYLGSERT